MRLFCKLPRDQRAVVITQIRKAHALGRDLPEVDLADDDVVILLRLGQDRSLRVDDAALGGKIRLPLLDAGAVGRDEEGAVFQRTRTCGDIPGVDAL